MKIPNSLKIFEIEQEKFIIYCRNRMSVDKEFVGLFYEVLSMAAYEGKNITHRQAFDLLNDLYCFLSGHYRYSSYESFQKSQSEV